MTCSGSGWSLGTWLSWWGLGYGRGCYRRLHGSYACWRFVGPHTCRHWTPWATSFPNPAACQGFFGGSWRPVVSWWLSTIQSHPQRGGKVKTHIQEGRWCRLGTKAGQVLCPEGPQMWLWLLLRTRLREWLVGCGNWGSPGSMQVCCCALHSGDVSGLSVCVELCRRL